MTEKEIIKHIKNDIEIDIDTMSWFEDKNNPTRKQIEEGVNAYQRIIRFIY